MSAAVLLYTENGDRKQNGDTIIFWCKESYWTAQINMSARYWEEARAQEGAGKKQNEHVKEEDSVIAGTKL
jgi:hypothetical protein